MKAICVLSAAAGADDRFLDRRRRVFRHHHAAASGGRQRHAAGLAERKRRAGVGVHEGFLDRAFVRLLLFEDRAQRLEEIVEARSELLIGARLDDAVRDVGEARALTAHHAPAATIKARVNTEDENAAHELSALRRNPCQSANGQA